MMKLALVFGLFIAKSSIVAADPLEFSSDDRKSSPAVLYTEWGNTYGSLQKRDNAPQKSCFTAAQQLKDAAEALYEGKSAGLVMVATAEAAGDHCLTAIQRKL